MGRWNTGWLIEGTMHPHPFGPGAEAANTPAMVLPEFGASPEERAAVVGFPVPVGSSDFSDPQARLRIWTGWASMFKFSFPLLCTRA